MISCILLSAGLSQRFGSPKALAEINGEKIIVKLQKMLISSGVNEIIIVLGAESDKIIPYILKHEKVKFVYNKDYNFGQTSSFKAGLKDVPNESQAFFLLPVDYPFVSKENIDSIIDSFSSSRQGIIIPAYQGRKGHPPIFDISYKKEFLGLGNDKGLNLIAHNNNQDICIVDIDDISIISSFNTKEELESLLKDYN